MVCSRVEVAFFSEGYIVIFEGRSEIVSVQHRLGLLKRFHGLLYLWAPLLVFPKIRSLNSLVEADVPSNQFRM